MIKMTVNFFCSLSLALVIMTAAAQEARPITEYDSGSYTYKGAMVEFLIVPSDDARESGVVVVRPSVLERDQNCEDCSKTFRVSHDFELFIAGKRSYLQSRGLGAIAAQKGNVEIRNGVLLSLSIDEIEFKTIEGES